MQVVRQTSTLAVIDGRLTRAAKTVNGSREGLNAELNMHDFVRHWFRGLCRFVIAWFVVTRNVMQGDR